MASLDKVQEVHREDRVLTPTQEQEKFEIDAVHTDEAMKVIAAYSGRPTWDPLEEKRIRRKLDKRLLPILTITYALQYYDKGMNHPCCVHLFVILCSFTVTR